MKKVIKKASDVVVAIVCVVLVMGYLYLDEWVLVNIYCMLNPEVVTKAGWSALAALRQSTFITLYGLGLHIACAVPFYRDYFKHAWKKSFGDGDLSRKLWKGIEFLVVFEMALFMSALFFTLMELLTMHVLN